LGKTTLEKHVKNIGATAVRFFKRTVEEAGSALVIVLTVIFVLSTIGGITIIVTYNNYMMSTRYLSWASDYYKLDFDAEITLKEIDDILLKAEDYASRYMRDGCYRIGDARPEITGDPLTELGERSHYFIHNYWYNSVYSPSLTVNPYGIEETDEAVYSSLFEGFNEEFSQRLYYYYAYKLLEIEINESGSSKYGDLRMDISPMMAGFAGMKEGYAADPGGLRVSFEAADNEAPGKYITVTLNVTAPVYATVKETEQIPFKTNPIWTNAVAARGSLIFRGAPGRTLVFGDVVSQDYKNYYEDYDMYVVLDGNDTGLISDGATVGVFGNVYSAGDLHVTGSGGSFNIFRYAAGMKTGFKDNAFANTLRFDISSLPALTQRFTQLEDGEWQRAHIPFIYRDINGGNVYCNGVVIERNVDGAQINIFDGLTDVAPGLSSLSGALGVAGFSGLKDSNGLMGVVWVNDDVRNNGVNSSVRIDGNLIGISSEALFNDPLSSSAVINADYTGGRIELNGAVVMPGVAFMRFDGLNDILDEDVHFETAESISATNEAIFKGYTIPPKYRADAMYYFDIYNLRTDWGLMNLFVVNYDIMNDKVRHLAGNLSDAIPKTGVVTNDKLEGYTRGLVIAEDSDGNSRLFGAPGSTDIENYNEIINYTPNYLAYSEVKDALRTAFLVKTQKFGTSGLKFGDLIDKSALLDENGRFKRGLGVAVTYYEGDGYFDLSNDRGGIVYCAASKEGDGEIPTLTIGGNGVFRGVVLSEGDVVVTGSPTIIYDEGLISQIILSFPEVRDFFKPGEMGNTSYLRVEKASSGAKSLVKKRYEIAEWTQWQE